MNNSRCNIAELNAAIIARMEDFCREFYPHGRRAGGEWKIGSFAGEPGNSCGISLCNGKAHDWSTGEGAGNPLEILIHRQGGSKRRNEDFREALRTAQAWLGWGWEHQHSPSPLQARLSDSEAARRQAEKEARERAEKRKHWPRFIESPEKECRSVARLRQIPLEGVQLAHRLGYLRFCSWKNRPAWIICNRSRTLAQVRRMDGEIWGGIGKAQTLPGSVGGLIGEEILSFPGRILLTEGGPDFLAGCYLFHLSRHRWPNRPELHWLPLAFLGASHRFNARQVNKLEGRELLIVAHFDENQAGEKAARVWRDQLHGYARSISLLPIRNFEAIQPCGSLARDLNDLMRCPREFNHLTEYLLHR